MGISIAPNVGTTRMFAYLSLGSNLGDREQNLKNAILLLRNLGFDVARLSAIYETEPVGTLPQPKFLNLVAELRINTGDPETLMTQLLEIEQQLGRTREILKGPRVIDLDLLLYDDQIRDTRFLTLPHPRLHERRFVLVPLAELAPNLTHPVLHKTMQELLQSTTDQSSVVRWSTRIS
jgi:2-amino-4-hydroxy-6-hydroxymethyldihydropteridine diphosphokinase